MIATTNRRHVLLLAYLVTVMAETQQQEIPATLAEKDNSSDDISDAKVPSEPSDTAKEAEMAREQSTIQVPEPTPVVRPLEPSPPKEDQPEVEMFTLHYPIRKQQIHLRDAEGRIVVGEQRTTQANHIIAEWFVNDFLQNKVASAVMMRIIQRDFPDEFAVFKMPLEHEMELLDGIAEVCNGRVEEIEDLLDKDDAESYQPSTQEEETVSEAPSSQEKKPAGRRRKELISDEHLDKKKQYKTAVDYFHRQNPTLGTRIGRQPLPAKRGRD